MLCTKCGSANPTDAAFCEQCGHKLEFLCPACKEPATPGARFCKNCGASLDGTRQRSKQSTTRSATRGELPLWNERAAEVSEGERKVVTALFADMKGSTELMEELDPEEARALIDPALKLMIDAVSRYDGYIVQSTGDGVFALFGAPLAHEDHPQRALYAALRMQEEVRHYGARLQEQGRAPIEIRIGINSGEVVVRSLHTGKAHTEYTPIGHTANLASRLQAIARTGSILVSESTRRLVEGYFQLRALGSTRVKGITEPVQVYEVTGLGPLRTRFLQRAAGRGLTKFVGRVRELDALRDVLELAKAGNGQIVAVTGEPGVGKSRLFFEFKAIGQSGCMLLEAYSISHGKASAYLPLLELLRDYFRITPEDGQRQRREKITGKVLTLERSSEDTLPHLFALFGLQDKDDLLIPIDPQLRRRRTQEAIKRILLRESLSQPLLVIFEDLHWIDDQTQGFLNLLADSIGTARILLMVNYRPEYSHHWNSKTYYTQLRLAPLGRESAEELLSSLIGDAIELKPIKRMIIERSEGNPFFIEEMVQALSDEGVLVRNGVVKVARSLSQVRVPPTVQGVLASRIDRLPAPEKEFLQTLAILGREFSLSLVREVAARPDEELERLLATLQLGEFIYEQPAIPQIEYIFKHALTQEVAYRSMLNERRRALHERAGAALERLFGERLDEHLGELAHHYELGANTAKAVHYLSLAALRTVHQGLLAEGTEQADHALKLLATLPDTTERAQQELQLLTALALATGFAKGFGAPEALPVCQRAAALSRRLGDSRKLFGILTMITTGHLERGELASADGYRDEVRALAAKIGDMAYVSAAAVHDAWITLWLGRFRESSEYAERAIINRLDSGYAIAEWLLRPDVLGRHIAGLALWPLGYPDRALARAEEALREPNIAPTDRACALHALAEVCAWRGELERSYEAAREELEICQTFGITAGVFGCAENALATLGWVLLRRGEFAEALKQLSSAVEEIRARGRKLFVPLYLGRLALGHLAIDDQSSASTVIAQAFSLANQTGERAWDAELWRAKGEIAVKRGENDEAVHAFRSAIEIAQAQEARSWELRAATSLARLLIQQNRSEEAHALLVPIHGWFTEGFDTADLKEAKALLTDQAQERSLK